MGRLCWLPAGGYRGWAHRPYGGFSRSAWGPSATGPEGLRGYNFDEQGQHIPFEGEPMWLYVHGSGCVSCHGEDGRGGVPVIMSREIPSDIRYEHLIEEEHEEGEDHPPYTDEPIKRTITEGLDPAREPLDLTMPHFRMSEADLNDLLDYLKGLE